MVEITVNETTEALADNTIISTRVRKADHTLSFKTTNQVLNIPKEEKAISYYFQFNKLINDSFSSSHQEESSGEIKQKLINTTSQIICLSEDTSPCQVEPLNVPDMFACKCSQSSRVSIGEQVITRINYIRSADDDNQVITMIKNNNSMAFLAFLSVVPVGLAVVVVVMVAAWKKRKRNGDDENPKYEDEEADLQAKAVYNI